jgi:secondary thiamine-phosphate synthase enzyme
MTQPPKALTGYSIPELFVFSARFRRRIICRFHRCLRRGPPEGNVVCYYVPKHWPIASFLHILSQEGASMKSLSVRTQSQTQFVDITRQIQSSISELGLKSGIITVFVPHTTAGITINENADPDVTSDIAEALDRTIPWNAGYSHSEGNAAAHVKASMMGSSVHLIVDDGRLQLGTWQAVYFCEFDGPRSRKVWLAAA